MHRQMSNATEVSARVFFLGHPVSLQEVDARTRKTADEAARPRNGFYLQKPYHEVKRRMGIIEWA